MSDIKKEEQEKQRNKNSVIVSLRGVFEGLSINLIFSLFFFFFFFSLSSRDSRMAILD